jgi:hypothetical protein
MDPEIEQQIDELIHKSTKDLKNRIVRLVVRHQNKLLKDQARELKSGQVSTVSKRPSAKQPVQTTSRKSKKKYEDSDSEYYSE